MHCFPISNDSMQFEFLACISRLENSVDLDQLASENPADLDLHCFQKQDISSLSMVNVYFLHAV